MIHMHRKSRVILPTIIALLIITGCQKTNSGADTAGYGYVIESTQTDTVESSGSIEPYQMTTLSWKTSGSVLTVDVESNQAVVKGTILATLDPSTAPTSVNQAISDLIAARQELDDAKNSRTASAQAEVTLAAAKDAYYLALGYYNTLGKQIGNENYINILTSAVLKAEQAVEDAETNYNRFAEASANDVNKAAALARLSQAKIDLKTAQNNLKYYQSVPNAMDSATITAEFNLAKAQLDDAQRAYDKLKDGTNTDAVISAQAKVDAAQATVDSLSIIAPFDGDVAVIYPRVGDLVSSNTEAAILVNRSSLFIEVYIDETTISSVAVGNPVIVTFDAIPELSMPGKVEFINPVGVVSSGVVNYTVRVELNDTDPRILIGQTANVTIQTGEPHTVLYVPVTSVQSDAQGEYVIRVKSDGTRERVSVVSGTIIDDLVVVAGDLAADDQVLLYTSTYSSTTENNGLNSGRGGFMIGSGSEGGQSAPGGIHP
jgi:multidrug efflux pump subunit AcrA (membrane-fusion protein)